MVTGTIWLSLWKGLSKEKSSAGSWTQTVGRFHRLAGSIHAVIKLKYSPKDLKSYFWIFKSFSHEDQRVRNVWNVQSKAERQEGSALLKWQRSKVFTGSIWITLSSAQMFHPKRVGLKRILLHICNFMLAECRPNCESHIHHHIKQFKTLCSRHRAWSPCYK